MTVLVVGLGSPDRRDDGVGCVVAQQVAARGLDGVDVRVHADPSELLHVMHGYDEVVVVDAMRSGDQPGAVAVLPTAPPGTGAAGTHDLGLAQVLALARAVDRLPEHLQIVAIEAADCGYGNGLSAPVQRAVPAAVAAVVDACGRWVPLQP